MTFAPVNLCETIAARTRINNGNNRNLVSGAKQAYQCLQMTSLLESASGSALEDAQRRLVREKLKHTIGMRWENCQSVPGDSEPKGSTGHRPRHHTGKSPGSGAAAIAAKQTSPAGLTCQLARDGILTEKQRVPVGNCGIFAIGAVNPVPVRPWIH
jgi:hypothetical protein